MLCTEFSIISCGGFGRKDKKHAVVCRSENPFQIELTLLHPHFSSQPLGQSWSALRSLTISFSWPECSKAFVKFLFRCATVESSPKQHHHGCENLSRNSFFSFLFLTHPRFMRSFRTNYIWFNLFPLHSTRSLLLSYLLHHWEERGNN